MQAHCPTTFCRELTARLEALQLLSHYHPAGQQQSSQQAGASEATAAAAADGKAARPPPILDTAKIASRGLVFLLEKEKQKQDKQAEGQPPAAGDDGESKEASAACTACPAAAPEGGPSASSAPVGEGEDELGAQSQLAPTLIIRELLRDIERGVRDPPP